MSASCTFSNSNIGPRRISLPGVSLAWKPVGSLSQGQRPGVSLFCEPVGPGARWPGRGPVRPGARCTVMCLPLLPMEIWFRQVSLFYCRNHNFEFPRTQIYYLCQDLILRSGWKKSVLFAVFKEIFSVAIFSMKILWIGVEKWPIATLRGLKGP